MLKQPMIFKLLYCNNLTGCKPDYAGKMEDKEDAAGSPDGTAKERSMPA